MVQAVLFDLDETLLDRISSVHAFVVHQFSGDFGSFESAQALADRFTELDDRNNVAKTSVYRQIFDEMGHTAPGLWRDYFADFETHSWRYARPYSGMTATLRSLRDAGYRIGIITNGETHLQLRSILALDLDRLVDTYLISESEACRKPDADIFLRAAERLDVPPQNCAFVGDTPQTDMIGARQVGMRTIWFPNGLTWPEDYDWRPDAEIAALDALMGVLNGFQCRSSTSDPDAASSAGLSDGQPTFRDKAQS